MSLLVDGITIILGYIVQEGNRIKVNEGNIEEMPLLFCLEDCGVEGRAN